MAAPFLSGAYQPSKLGERANPIPVHRLYQPLIASLVGPFANAETPQCGELRARFARLAPVAGVAPVALDPPRRCCSQVWAHPLAANEFASFAALISDSAPRQQGMLVAQLL